MKKVSKIKKQFKGTKYIAYVLKRYFNKRYPTYNSALPKAKEILEQLKSQGLRVNTKNIRSLGVAYKKAPKGPIKDAPFLYYKLAQPLPYFNFQDYPFFIKKTSNEVFFVSELFNEGVGFVQGGTKPSYSQTFSSYVNYVNQEIEDEPTAYEQDYLVVCEPPVFNPQNQRWESKIVSKDEKGNVSNYGYSPIPTPSGLAFKPTDPSAKKPKIAKGTKQEKATKNEEIQKIEAETEKTRQENLNMAMKLFLNKEITKTEYKEMVELIKKQK
jgi:hypothetical protein